MRARHLIPRPGRTFAPRSQRIVGSSDTLAPGAVMADRDGDTMLDPSRLETDDGAFAIAWADATGGVHLARDAIGHRTLYYSVQRGRLVFASKLRVLLDTFDVPRRLDMRALAWFLSCAYVPGRRTLIEDVFEVLPGERVTFRDGVLSHAELWRMPAEPADAGDEHDLQQRLRAQLECVIGAALPPGEPVCASLSGGIDSSLVVALAKRLHGQPVRTFSITFGDEYKNELAFSSQVAEHVQSEHYVVELRPETIMAHLDDTIACMDKPNGDPLTVPNALLFREMREYGNVVLNGEGGDPCFGGPKNAPMLLAELYGDFDGGDPQYSRERSYLRAHLKCFDELAAILTPEAYAKATTPPLEHELAPWFHDPRWPSFVGTLMAINVRFKGGHHILPKVDALAEPFAVVPRSPLFSRALVELAFAIPSTLKLRGSVEKYLLKQAVRDLLPASIIDRPKSGMLVPVEGWFQGPLAHHARERLLDRFSKLPICRPAMLEQLLTGKHLGLRPRRGVKIWLLVTLESHLRALGVS